MPLPGTHIPLVAARWLPSTVTVTESKFHVVTSGYRISARLARNMPNDLVAFRLSLSLLWF